MMKKVIQLFAVALAVLACLNGLAQSVPQLINYQGQLLDASGNPMPTGDYEVEVRLFPVETGGAAIWGPQLFNGQSGPGLGPKVPVVQGRFNLILGPQDTGARDLVSVFGANPNVYIELKVGTGDPISPRQQILTAPFALNTAKMSGFDWSALFSGGNPQAGNLGLGIAPSEVKLDVNGRGRVRQGNDASAGIWFSQTTGGDKGFVGMLDDTRLGFSLPSGFGALTVDTASGVVNISSLQATTLRLFDSGIAVSPPAVLTVTRNSFSSSTLRVNVVSTVFTGTVSATSFTTTSDQRLKDDVETIHDPLQILSNLHGVSYIPKAVIAGASGFASARRVGVLAQEVQRVLPEAVQTGPDGYLAVEYGALTPVLIEAVKEQQKQINELKAEIAALKARQP